MKSLLPLVISLVGFFILLLIYYVFIYQKKETPFDVFLKLIRHNKETILAFTYKKNGPEEYLNYYVNDNLELEPRIEKYPVTFEGLPVDDVKYHGIISDIDNGFIISGIEFPFRCPNGWTYNNGKCELENICKPDDIDVYKGISYYHFNEAFKAKRSTVFHPRLFMDCNTNERKHCEINELYVGGESISNIYQPCEPYDLCQDLLTMTTHNYPIFVGDKLGPNEFYICQNGVSQRRSCPENTQFSRTQNGCLPVSRCFDREDNTTIYTGNPNQFILCLNGQENVVRCANGVFNGGPNQIECVNSICLNPRLIFHRFRDVTIPIGRQFCPNGTNTPQQFLCDLNTTLFQDNVEHIINSTDQLPTIDPPHPRFSSFEVPDTTYNSETDLCVPFTFDANFVILGTHNDILPLVPINLSTLEITHSGLTVFYFKNYNKIMQHPDNTIIVSDKKYANFVTISDLSVIEYVDSVKTATGDKDGVNYLISGLNTTGLLSTETIFKNPDGILGAGGLAWNVYTQTFTNVDDAHCSTARMFLGQDFSSISYIFKYRVLAIQGKFNMYVLTPYGYVTFEIQLLDDVTVQGLFLNIKKLPMYEKMEKILEGPNTTMIVTDIYNKNYNPKHMPYFLDYVNIVSVVSPASALSMNIMDFFEIDSTKLFKSNALFI